MARTPTRSSDAGSAEATRTQRSAAREPIVAAAAALFRERGFAGASMQDIADAAGLSRPALYYHYNSKDEILAELVAEITVHTAQAVERIAAGANDRPPRVVLHDAVRAHAARILERPQHFSVLQREERHLPASERAVQEKGKRALLDRLSAIIAEGVRVGAFRSVDASVAALSIFGMCAWTVEWFRPSGRMSAERVADQIADFAVAMVAREPARPGRSAGEGSAMDVAGWIAVLRDDLAHLERVAAPRKNGPTEGER